MLRIIVCTIIGSLQGRPGRPKILAPTDNWPVYSLIYRTVSKTGAPRKAQMSYFKDQIRWGSTPDHAGGAYNASCGPLAVFKGPTFQRTEGKVRAGRRRGGKIKGREGERRWME